MKLFLGEYDHAIDERGRVTLPRKIRQEIEETEIVLARGYEGCIFGFDKSSWEREAAKHLDTPVTDDKGREVRRYLFGSAQKADVDKLGRILLPAQLKEYASISREVKVIGAGDHFELWDSNRWRAYAERLGSV
jgi:MraZ protein